MLTVFKNKRILIGIVALLIVAAIPLTIFQLSQTQETRSGASGEAVAVILDPLTKNVAVGEEFDVQVKLNTGQNNVTAVDISITYDPLLLRVFSFVQTPSLFSQVQNTTGNGTVHYVGVNPSAGTITGNDINLGTIKFGARAEGAATVGFSNIHVNASGTSSALPVDTSNTQVATFTIGASGSAAISNTPSPTTFQATITPTTSSSQTVLNLTLNLVGIGSSTGSGLNTSPQKTQRSIEAKFYNSQGVLAYSSSGSATFNSASGQYISSLGLGNISSGDYLVKVRMDNTLWKQIPGIITITQNAQNQTPVTQLVTGDVNGDNEINLVDYTLLLACIKNLSNCPTPFSSPGARIKAENLIAFYREK